MMWSSLVLGAILSPSFAVEGSVEAQESRWSGGVIVTRSTLHVPPALDLVVEHLGGAVDGVGQLVSGEPVLRLGEHVRVHLAPGVGTWRVVGEVERLVTPRWVRSTTLGASSVCTGPERPLLWNAVDVDYVVDSAGSADVPLAAAQAAIDAAMEAWNGVDCAYLRFHDVGSAPDLAVGFTRGGDNQNVVKWIESGWADWSTRPDALAVTLTTFGCDSGHMYDADVLLNGEHVTFTASPDGEAGRVDVQNVMTHELGHAAGFDHDPDPASTMYFESPPGETEKRTLSDDDVAGFCTVYPLGQEPVAEESGCACRAGGSRAPAGWPVVALPLLLLLGRRRHARDRRS